MFSITVYPTKHRAMHRMDNIATHDYAMLMVEQRIHDKIAARVVALGENHIAFYVQGSADAPGTYQGVITYNRDPEPCGDCGSSCEQGNCKNWKSVSESNPY